MKLTRVMALLLMFILLTVNAQAATWYVYTPNGKTLNLRSPANNAVIGNIPNGFSSPSFTYSQLMFAGSMTSPSLPVSPTLCKSALLNVRVLSSHEEPCAATAMPVSNALTGIVKM